MSGSGESSAQRAERLEAERVRDEAKRQQDEEETRLFEDEQLTAKNKLSYNKRKLGMRGGGREGLMYQGSNIGVKR